MTRRVLILQETLPEYRVPLFREIRRQAAERAMSVDVAHGFAIGPAGHRLNTGTLEGSVHVTNRYLRLPGPRQPAVWQGAIRECMSSDLVVVEQANRLLLNYVLLATRTLRGPKVAFWGHGKNMQGSSATLAERAKTHIAMRPSWWFAYTDSVASYLEKVGYPAWRITVVGNTIDVAALGLAVQQLRIEGLEKSSHRCLFLGGLYREKRLDLLFDAADTIIQRDPAFELHLAGTGELQQQVERFAAARSWVTYHGRVEGLTRARLLASSALLLMPGLVGLVVLDSFASGVPVVTLVDSLHSPEFDYIVPDRNGVVLGAGADARTFAAAIIELLADKAKLRRLSEGALDSVRHHSIDACAERFVSGLSRALDTAG
jgi:L-malate glycosyltransferase